MSFESCASIYALFACLFVCVCLAGAGLFSFLHGSLPSLSTCIEGRQEEFDCKDDMNEGERKEKHKSCRKVPLYAWGVRRSVNESVKRTNGRGRKGEIRAEKERARGRKRADESGSKEGSPRGTTEQSTQSVRWLEPRGRRDGCFPFQFQAWCVEEETQTAKQIVKKSTVLGMITTDE
mmetsp:Transcript_30182/g.59245  ORF Transcript_30182/g.59245 Transcript_30182/m.59245 type:complete len:178 (-) Transcript_30182:317-850(-)